MASERLSYLDYLKAAFHWKARVPGLGAMPVNYLGLAAFAVLGIANPGFWLLGGALELGYLTWLSSNERFQKLVQGRRLQEAKRGWESQLQETLQRLRKPSQERYRRLLAQCRAILGIAQALEQDDLGTLRRMRTGGLNQMLWIFLRLLASREVLEDNLNRVDREAVEKDVEDLEARVAEADPESPLARSLQGTLEIQRRRLENLARARESLAVVDAELERIEHQVVLLREESAVSGKAEVLSSRLDAVSTALTETHDWMEQNARVFEEIGADPLGSAPPDLPDLPATELGMELDEEADGADAEDLPPVPRRRRRRETREG